MTLRIALTLVCVSLLTDSLPTKVRKSAPSYALSFDAAKVGREKISVDPLRGIPAVFVSTTRLSPSARDSGLSRADIDRIIEDDLNKHRVPLRPQNDEEREKPPKYAMLSADVRVVAQGKTIAYDVTLSLHEMLQRQHDRDVFVHAPIWRCRELSIVTSGQTKNEIIKAIHAAVDDFSAAFTAAHTTDH